MHGNPTATGRPRLPALEARRWADAITLGVIPAGVGGLLTYQHVGQLSDAVLVFAAMLAITQLAQRTRYPLHLMPASQVVLLLASPVIGVLLGVGLGVVDGTTPTLGQVTVPVVGAWMVMGLGAWVDARIKDGQRVRVAVVGPQQLARALKAELTLAGIDSYEIYGWIGGGQPGGSGSSGSLRRLGGLDDLRNVVLQGRIDLLVYATGPQWVEEDEKHSDYELLERIADACLDLPVRMIDANQLYEELLGHVPLGNIDAAWFRYIMHPRYRASSPLSKRLLDLAIGSLAGLFLLPVLAIAAVAIKLDSPGPVLFRQRRVGEHGEEFEIVKLRTMDDAGEHVTRVGRFLIRAHVNEFPQLLNVLRGEMSLVGPRPEPADLVAQLERQFPHYERRHLVKPGITGWAQIRCGYAGSEMGSAWKLCHELYYFKHRSLLADLLLMVETLAVAARDAEAVLRRPDERFILRGAGAESHN